MHFLNNISVLFIFIVVLSHFVVTQDVPTTYNIPDGQYLNNGFLLNDESILLHFTIPINESCYEPNLRLRILHNNGTSSSLEVENFSPSSLNFCNNNDTDMLFTTGDYLFILYYNISESDPTAPFGQFILQVNVEGKIVSDTWLVPASYENNTFVGGGSIITINDKSFMHIVERPDDFLWKKFDIIGGKLELSDVSSGPASKEELKQHDIRGIFGAYNGFGVIHITRNDTVTINSLQPTLSIYVTFFKPEINRFTKSFIIYQTTIANVDLDDLDCRPDFIRIEFKCLITLRRTTSTINNVLLISFLSSGSVINIEETKGIPNNVIFPSFIHLPYGGYFFVYGTENNENDGNGCTISGDIIDQNNKWYSRNTYDSKACIIFPFVVENYFDLVYEIQPSYITVIKSTLPKFINDGRGSKIIAANINSTEPSFNSTIQLGTNRLKIHYAVTISPSTQNITIYQANGVMRQTQSGQSCIVDPDHKTISLNVLPSTFNTPNSVYYILIDSNFVKGEINDEPMLGLDLSIWNLYTGRIEDKYTDSYYGSVRLTPEGTTYFNNFNKTEFINQLKQEISLILPVDLDRLSTTGSCQIDTSTPSNQIIIPLQIKDTRDLSKRNTNNLQKDLNILIENKEFTGISIHKHTLFLDNTYGYKPRVSIDVIVRDHKNFLIMFAAIFVILAILFLWAKKHNSEAKNIIIFQIVLTVADFALDASFVYHNGHDVPGIYIPSLIFLIVPTCLNLIVAVSLMIYENLYNAPFHDWFKLHVPVASLFTILGAANIEVLHILSSKFAGLNMFSVNYLERTKLLLFWFGLLNFILEDIPQFTIQVYYKTHIVTYNIIPFLTLITSSLAIILSVTVRLYMLIIKWKERKEKRQYKTADVIQNDNAIEKQTADVVQNDNAIINNESKDDIEVEIQK